MNCTVPLQLFSFLWASNVHKQKIQWLVLKSKYLSFIKDGKQLQKNPFFQQFSGSQIPYICQIKVLQLQHGYYLTRSSVSPKLLQVHMSKFNCGYISPCNSCAHILYAKVSWYHILEKRRHLIDKMYPQMWNMFLFSWISVAIPFSDLSSSVSFFSLSISDNSSKFFFSDSCNLLQKNTNKNPL